jgi:hypothetical protein
MTNLAHLLGLAPGSSAVLLGPPAPALAAALTAALAGGRLAESAAGRGLADQSCDAAVIGGEAAADPRLGELLAAAARAVRPDGTVALELPNPRQVFVPLLLAYEGVAAPTPARSGPDRAQAAALCRAAGLTRVTAFLSLPGLADPRLVLPLDSPAAAAFHFRPPFFPESCRRRLLRRALGALAARGGLAALSPAFTLLASPADRR